MIGANDEYLPKNSGRSWSEVEFGLRLEANRSKSTMYDLNQPGIQAAPHELLEVGLHLRKLMMLGASLARWPDPCVGGRYIDKVYYVQGCS